MINKLTKSMWKKRYPTCADIKATNRSHGASEQSASWNYAWWQSLFHTLCTGKAFLQYESRGDTGSGSS